MTSRKLERTLNLLAELLNAESPKSAEELRKRVGMYPEDKAAFRRTFDRDKNALRDMGVPLEIIPVPGTNPPIDGYIINKSDYYLDKLDLKPSELRALNLAISSVEVLAGISEIEAMRKLGGYEESPETSTIRVPLLDGEYLTLLFDAITNRKSIKFIYSQKNRELEPWRLEFTNGRWYVTGKDSSSSEIRTFRVDKILGISLGLVANEYEIPDNPPKANMKPWSYGDGEKIETIIRIDETLLDWARTSLDTEIELNNDGSGIAKVFVSNQEAFFSRLTLLLEHAEIISPVEIRDAYIAYMNNFVEVSNGNA
tara:strand:+ start:3578 stop:4513 length:936 start_codon:yes stop_codon:yes gene_type:complete